MTPAATIDVEHEQLVIPTPRPSNIPPTQARTFQLEASAATTRASRDFLQALVDSDVMPPPPVKEAMVSTLHAMRYLTCFAIPGAATGTPVCKDIVDDRNIAVVQTSSVVRAARRICPGIPVEVDCILMTLPRYEPWQAKHADRVFRLLDIVKCVSVAVGVDVAVLRQFDTEMVKHDVRRQGSQEGM